METQSKSIKMFLSTEYIEDAIKFINEHNTLIEEVVSKDDVVDFIIEQWIDEEYLFPLMYNGIMIFPQLVKETDEEIHFVVHFGVLPTFTPPDPKAVEVYDLSVPEDYEVH